MRLTTIALSLCAVTVLTACGTRRETIVERPTVIQPAPAAVIQPSAGSTAVPAGCIYGSGQYSDGAMACQNGAPYRCRAGTWERSLGSC